MFSIWNYQPLTAKVRCVPARRGLSTHARLVTMKRPCGKHATLSDNDGARVSQCPCGAVHLLVKATGVTMQLSEERFQQVGLAVMGAIAELGNKSEIGVNMPLRTIN